ncbi:ELMD2-like protein [Mya arenaria]|uniref:ELMD2-like protein n=1 Tax=Mya arenaria TaxID=6604 RepID=A0ABY7DPD2_MYAAR|nr:ELMD2-like protein [Mya arenaria]
MVGFQGSVTNQNSTKYSLKRSSSRQLQRLVKEEDTNIEAAVVLVMKEKKVFPEVHSQFEPIFRQSLIQINGYVCLMYAVENLRQIKFSSENSDHEKKLMKLWGILGQGEALTSRISSQWTQIGFQGNDPMTDFRGMGLLGLEQLLYFCTKYGNEAKAMLSRSHHPKTGYSYAIVGINMTELVYHLMKTGRLRTHFYNKFTTRCVFHEFDSFWISENPKDIMDFGRIREKYRKKIASMLKDRKTILSASFQET